MKVVKATGWTWRVWYQWDGEEVDGMVVAALTAQTALEEAKFSLSLGGDDYTILGLVRDDMQHDLGN